MGAAGFPRARPRHVDYGPRMRRWYQVFLPLLGLLLGRELFSWAVPMKARGVARVLDGDTLEFRGARLRLRGVDAPERGQPFLSAEGDAGALAARCAQGVLSGGDWEFHWRGRDFYGRVLADGWRGGEWLAEVLVERGCGLAYFYPGSLSVGEAGRLRRAQNRAFRSRAGLWAKGGIINPSHWRKAQKARRRPVATE